MSKGLLAIVLAIIMSVALLVLAVVVWETLGLARQGTESHAVLCQVKAEHADQVAQTKAFLALSPAQRLKKYGPIGDIPDATLRASLRVEEHVYAAYRTLSCPTEGAR